MLINNKKEKPKFIKDLMAGGNGRKAMTLEDVLAKAKTLIMRSHPFWGVIVASCDIYFDETKGKTAWTDGYTIGFNPKFFGELTIPELNFIMAHEVWHIANLHIPRLKAKHPLLWNHATDHWINLTLAEDAQRLPHVFQVPDMERIFNDHEAGLLMDKQYVDMAPEAIYADIVKKQKDNAEGKNKGTSQGSSDKPKGLGGDLDYSEFNQGDAKTQEDKARELAEQWKGIIASATDAAKKAGNMPGNLQRQVDELLKPKVDYVSLLAAYVSSCLYDYDFTKPDRRFTEEDFVVPDLDGDMLEAAVVIDTSGSISDQMIKQFISETYMIIASFPHVKGTLIGHDHEVHDWHEFNSQQLPPKTLKGGGGTAFKPVFDACKLRDYKPNVMVWFTDMQGDFPDKHTDWPIIIVGVNTPLKPPSWCTAYIPITV